MEHVMISRCKHRVAGRRAVGWGSGPCDSMPASGSGSYGLLSGRRMVHKRLPSAKTLPDVQLTSHDCHNGRGGRGARGLRRAESTVDGRCTSKRWYVGPSTR